jgi:predicted ester cyclase
MSADANKAVVRRYFEECWNKGNLAALDECMGPDISFGGEHETPESWRDALSRWLIALPDFQYHVDELVAEGDTVAANTHFTATHLGVFHHRKWGPWPPTGKSIDVREMIFCHLADGKIVEFWDSWDATSFAQQLGGDQPQATTTT